MAQHIFFKEAKAAALQLRSPAGWGGERNELKNYNHQLFTRFFVFFFFLIKKRNKKNQGCK